MYITPFEGSDIQFSKIIKAKARGDRLVLIVYLLMYPSIHFGMYFRDINIFLCLGS